MHGINFYILNKTLKVHQFFVFFPSFSLKSKPVKLVSASSILWFKSLLNFNKGHTMKCIVYFIFFLSHSIKIINFRNRKLKRPPVTIIQKTFTHIESFKKSKSKWLFIAPTNISSKIMSVLFRNLLCVISYRFESHCR